MELLACMQMFGEVRGSEIIELVERTTGGPCPCRQGLACPLVPDAVVAQETPSAL